MSLIFNDKKYPTRLINRSMHLTMLLALGPTTVKIKFLHSFKRKGIRQFLSLPVKVTPCPHSIPRAKFPLVHKLRFGFASWNPGCKYCRKYNFSPTIRKKEGQSCISYNIFCFIGINSAKIARNFVHITTLVRPCSPFPLFCCTKCNIRYRAYEVGLAPHLCQC